MLNEIKQCKDIYEENLVVGNNVIFDDIQQGKIVTIWNDGCVDIEYAHAHQGPVADSFDIIGHNVFKFPQYPEN